MFEQQRTWQIEPHWPVKRGIYPGSGDGADALWQYIAPASRQHPTPKRQSRKEESLIKIECAKENCWLRLLKEILLFNPSKFMALAEDTHRMMHRAIRETFRIPDSSQ